ncbi:protein-L-isoaspartate O-methyltransferase [Falsiroseomonas bella]|uniref:Protein-L-isoaspartate O-methyltransferase n=1 Tax=Falsiroseomonas bella TaxID=2184016 RepID=A0A317FCR4_9PROT|nr:protein-L-isoaspartate O-methyltransferase [Falsiroseomonas bella]PWS36293.1 protein-L-isoaspartate O-methyltransferase [Falsiroseomonas bella]
MQGDVTQDMAESRRRMVDGQLRPNRVTDSRLIAAMGEIPRERFLPPGLAARAYVDEDVRLPGGRGLIEPMVIARMLQLLSIRDGDRVLVVGAGTGYAATVAARCGARVVALEQDPALAAAARRATAGLVAPADLRVVEAPLAAGFPTAAPYDGILIEGEVSEIPAEITGQLAEGGRLVTVLAASERGQAARAVLGRRIGGSFSVTPAFDCATLALPAFARRPSFVF